jgi:hypothetical protein
MRAIQKMEDPLDTFHSNYSKEIQAGLSKSKTHTYLNATLDSKKWKESIHPLYEERLQARHHKRRPIWRVERPEDLKLSTILPIQEKKNQDYNNTVVLCNRQKLQKNCPQGSAGTVSSGIR